MSEYTTDHDLQSYEDMSDKDKIKWMEKNNLPSMAKAYKFVTDKLTK